MVKLYWKYSAVAVLLNDTENAHLLQMVFGIRRAWIHLVTHTDTYMCFYIKIEWWIVHDAIVSLIELVATHLPVKVCQVSGLIKITVSITTYVIKVINIDQSLLLLIGYLLWVMQCWRGLFVVMFLWGIYTTKTTFAQKSKCI